MGVKWGTECLNTSFSLPTLLSQKHESTFFIYRTPLKHSKVIIILTYARDINKMKSTQYYEIATSIIGTITFLNKIKWSGRKKVVF